MDIRLNFDLIGYKATPVEYQGMWNLNRTEQYCHSLGFLGNALDLEIRLETFVNECYFGPFGFLNIPSDPLDCFRRRYYPNLPIFKVSFMDEWDMLIDYIEWECNYESRALAAKESLRKTLGTDPDERNKKYTKGNTTYSTEAGDIIEVQDGLFDDTLIDEPSNVGGQIGDVEPNNNGELISDELIDINEPNEMTPEAPGPDANEDEWTFDGSKNVIGNENDPESIMPGI